MVYQIDSSRRSPNFSTREGRAVGMLVLHATVGSYGSSLSWLCNPTSGVSSSYLISKLGHIACLVPDDKAAWHAGKSFWKGLISAEIQHQSIGIELENANDGRDPWPAAQLDATAWLMQSLIATYHIPREMVVRHLDIAIPKGRKTDPAGFPWAAFVDRLYAAPPVFPTLYTTNTTTTIYQDSAATVSIGTAVKGTLLLIDGARYAQPTGHISKTSPNFPDLGFVRLADLDEVK
jgi:N-acetyl-anhydromuramyl-L-alanine amidase AmpD